MSHPNQTKQDAFFQLIPRYECPQCEGVIDPRGVRSTPVPPRDHAEAAQVLRKVECYCLHCDAAFSATQQLQNAQYVVIDGPNRLKGREAAAVRHWAEERINITRVEKLNRSAA